MERQIKVNIILNLTWLKLVGTIVAMVGLYCFVRGVYADEYVTEALGVLSLGLGTLGYRKWQTSKNIKDGNIQQ